MTEFESGAVAPEAPVVAQEPATPDATAAQPEAKPERTFTQKELDEIVQKRLAKESRKSERIGRLEADAAYLREQLAKSQPATPQTEGKPAAANFKDYEAYTEALTEWKANQVIKAHYGKSQEEQTQNQERQYANQVRDKLIASAKEFDDFEEVALSSHVPIDRPTAAFIAESDIGGKLAYHLGSHLDEAKEIARMSPAAQFRALVKLEEKLTATPKPTSVAPPIVPSAPNGPAKKATFDLPWKEFVAQRQKEVGRRR